MGRLKTIYRINKTLMFFSLLILVSFFLVTVTNAEEDHDRAKILKERGDIRPLGEILEKAQKDYPGTIIEVELEEEEGVIIYELEVLEASGVVRELKYDAKSGVFLKAEEEDRH